MASVREETSSCPSTQSRIRAQEAWIKTPIAGQMDALCQRQELGGRLFFGKLSRETCDETVIVRRIEGASATPGSGHGSNTRTLAVET